MRTREDAVRSVRRFAASALGVPPWRIRYDMQRFKRPFAMVNTPTAGGMQMAGPSSVRQSLPIIMQLYPAVPDMPAQRRVAEARMAAERAGELLNQALLFGVADAATEQLRVADDTIPEVRGYYRRIPLWNYVDANGDPLALEGAESVATQRFYCDYLWVDDGWTVHVQPEASEDQLFVALVNLRVQWFRSSRLRSPGTTLQRVVITPTGTLTVSS